MISNTLLDRERYSVHQDLVEELAPFLVAETTIREIVPEIRRLGASSIDMTVGTHEAKTAGREGKYTRGVYTKRRAIVTPQVPQADQPDLEIDDDALLDVVEQHLSNLNRQVVDLHNRVQSTLAEIRTLESE